MILQELKKIFGFKRILLIGVFAVLYYFLFFRLNVGIPSESSDRILLEVSLELLEKYGESMDEAEYQDLSESLADREESVIDSWIKENDDFRQHGIESYRDFIEKRPNLSDDVDAPLSSQILTDFTREEWQRAWEIACREMHLDAFVKAYAKEIKSGEIKWDEIESEEIETQEIKPDRPTTYYSKIPQQAQKRIIERNQEEVFSLMSYSAMGNYQRLFSDFSIFLLLSMIFLIVPYSVRDVMEGITVLQYTSLKGCRYYWKKLAAVLIGALILCMAETGWLILMLGRNHAFAFAGCFVSGFANPFITVMKLTFGQYMGMSMAYIAGVALALSLLTYSLSSYARNYISAIAFQIPAVIFSFIVSFGFMYNFAEITQNIRWLCMIPCICIPAAVIGNLIRFLSIKHYEQF